MTTTTLKRANTDLVAVALIEAILGQSGGVGARMPSEVSSWVKTGFVQIATVGGSPNIYVKLRRPVVEVKAKWIVPGSKQPPWFQANDLAERIVDGFYGQQADPREVVLPAGFERVLVQSAYALSEPRRIPADPSNIAVYQFDAQINWVPGGVG